MPLRPQSAGLLFDTAWVLRIQFAPRLQHSPPRGDALAPCGFLFSRRVSSNPTKDSCGNWARNGSAMALRQTCPQFGDRRNLAAPNLAHQLVDLPRRRNCHRAFTPSLAHFSLDARHLRQPFVVSQFFRPTFAAVSHGILQHTRKRRRWHAQKSSGFCCNHSSKRLRSTFFVDQCVCRLLPELS
jgi:hypothetical protein